MRSNRLKPLLAALSLVLAGTALAEQSPAVAPATGASAPAKPSVRPEVGKVLLEAQALINEKKFVQAKEKLQAASAFADKSPHESYLIALLTFNTAVHEDDGPTADKTVEQVMALNAAGQWAKPNDVVAWLQNVGVVHYRNKEYAAAAMWMERNLKEGGTSQQVKNVRIQSYLQSGSYKRVAELVDEEIALSQKEGRAPAQNYLEMMTQAASQLKDSAAGTRAVELLVTHYPKKEYWQSLVNRLWTRADLSTALQLDVYRLAVYTNALQETGDFVEYIDVAQHSGYSAEALAVFEKGAEAGLLGTDANVESHKKLHAKLITEAEQDRKTIAAEVVNASKKPNGVAMVNVGFSLIGQKQYDKGIELIEQGIAKGIPKRPMDARLRLGIACALAGQLDKAKQTFASVSGKEGLDELARYWTLAIRKP